MHRLHRVLKIVRLLHGHRLHTAGELAAECGVSRRTLFRDLEAIEQAGFTVWFDRRERAYRIHRRDFLPPINLSAAEAGELLILASLLDDGGGLPLLHGAREALSKLEVNLPMDTRLEALRYSRAAAVRLGPTSDHTPLRPAYAAIHGAIAALRRTACRYHGPGERVPLDLRLEPYWLVFHGPAWYVIGWSDYHAAVRTFRLDRLTQVTVLSETFSRPEGCTLNGYLGNAWGVMPGDKTYEVRLRFSPTVGPDVADVRWHRTQHTVRLADGSVLYTATVDGLDEIAWWVHGFGRHVEVLAPAVLRDRVADVASPDGPPPALDSLVTWAGLPGA
jgi:proteasome accessory factor B